MGRARWRANAGIATFCLSGFEALITKVQAVDHLKCIEAKELILIPDAGHFDYMTASDKILAALTAKVLKPMF